LAIAAYIRAALAADVTKRSVRDERPELIDVDVWLSQLEGLSPDDLGTCELRAQFDVAQGRVDQALTAVQKRAGKMPASAAATWAARLLDSFTQNYVALSANQTWIDATCQFYRDACVRDPQLRGPAVQFLVTHGRRAEALSICWDWAKQPPSGAALVA